MNKKLKAVIDFISRNTVWIILGAIAYFFLKPGSAEIQTFLLIAFLESTALALSGIALYVYTRIPFTKFLLEGDDGKINSSEKGAVLNVLGYIFLGVHILVGLIVLGVYIAQFAN